MQLTPQLDENEIRVLLAISRGIVRGNELAKRTGISSRTEQFTAIKKLLELDLIEVSPPVYDEKQIRKSVFSTLPSRRGHVRQLLMGRS